MGFGQGLGKGFGQGFGQGLGSCYSCIKYLMFTFNFLFWLMGCALLGVGIWVRVDANFKQYVESSESFQFLYTGAYTLIIVGVVVMVIGFLGCCGAIRESQCMLFTFFICLFVVFVTLVGIGIWAIVAKGSLKESVSETLNKAVDVYPENREFLDSLQENLKCCGADYGLADYKLKQHTCQIRYAVEPCTPKLFELFSDHLVIIAGVAIGIGVVTIFGMYFAVYLCCAIFRGRGDPYRVVSNKG